jgi:hypothetical protein
MAADGDGGGRRGGEGEGEEAAKLKTSGRYRAGKRVI